MSFQTWVKQQIASIISSINNLTSLSKSINEMNSTTTYVNGMKIAVYDPTDSETKSFPFSNPIDDSLLVSDVKTWSVTKLLNHFVDHTELDAALGNRLRIDVSNQALTNAQKLNALANLGVVGHVNIQGAKVEAAGKTDLTSFEVGDKFTAWLNNDTRYVVGKVIALPITLATDIDNNTKIKLAVDNLI